MASSLVALLKKKKEKKRKKREKPYWSHLHCTSITSIGSHPEKVILFSSSLQSHSFYRLPSAEQHFSTLADRKKEKRKNIPFSSSIHTTFSPQVALQLNDTHSSFVERKRKTILFSSSLHTTSSLTGCHPVERHPSIPCHP